MNYYAVIFTSQLSEKDAEYEKLNDALYKELSKQKGYLFHHSFRNEEGMGCSISYWESLEALKQWKELPLHLEAQQLGREKWYENYQVKICRVEKEYDWTK